MVPLVDTHCHLLPGLDDGPASWDDAIEMCRLAWADGVRAVAATCHQSEHWPEATAEHIRSTTVELARRLSQHGVSLSVYPCAEVMVAPNVERRWEAGQLVSMADDGKYLLIELPHQIFLDLRGLITRLVERGIRPVLAHPERHPELLEDNGKIEELIRRGCLIQVAAESITQDRYQDLTNRLKDWAQRGIMHLVCSDGHSPRRRPPGIANAYQRLVEWSGAGFADRVCYIHGMAILEGLPLAVSQPARLPLHKSLFRWWKGKSRASSSRTSS